MKDPAFLLKEFKKENDFLIGIDSDGCAFDTMEIKHKECFIPNIINEWGLQAVSKYAREAAEFVNLYSRWRGINRFPALLMVFDLLDDRDEVKKRGFTSPKVDSLRRWVETESKLGNPALEAAVAAGGDEILRRTLKWSNAVNETVEKIVRGVPPYPYAGKSFEKITGFADVIVVSATPGEALVREWEEHDIAKFVKVIAGQEMGKKEEHLKFAKQGRYEDEKVLMVGDASGDMKAAKANNVLFYPIIPGQEDESWQRFHDEAFDRFIKGEYKGSYEDGLINQFLSFLPETPPWK